MLTVTREDLKYTFDHAHAPVARIQPGEEFVVETEINVGKAIGPGDKEVDPSKITWPYVNPLTGPIYVEAAKAGNMLAVHLLDIEIEQPVYCAVFPGWSAFKTWFGREDFVPRTHAVGIENGDIVWNSRLRFPAKPMLGTIGTAPASESPSSVDNGRHGGNMDVQEVGPGHTLYLPCNVDGGLLYMGDAQAHQGDGELACTSIECRARVRLAVDVRRTPPSMSWPRIESSESFMTVVSLHPMEEALLTGFEQLLGWIREDYEADPVEAYMLLGQTLSARATAICNPKPTYLCKVKKSFLGAFPPRSGSA